MNRTDQLMLDGAPSFVITSMYAAKCSGMGVDTPDVTVVIKLPNELYKRLAKKGNLGGLVLDVNNEVYRLNPNIPSHCPTVGGQSDRASKGIKTLTFIYHVRDLKTAKALGIELHEFKNGSWCVKYGAHVNLLERKPAQLSVVR